MTRIHKQNMLPLAILKNVAPDVREHDESLDL